MGSCIGSKGAKKKGTESPGGRSGLKGVMTARAKHAEKKRGVFGQRLSNRETVAHVFGGGGEKPSGLGGEPGTLTNAA